MKHRLTIVILLTLLSIVHALEVQWDFSKSATSYCGKYQLTPVGDSYFTANGLEIPLTPRSARQGAKMAAPYPELTAGAFAMSFAFTLRAEVNPEPFDFLWDSKHDYFDKRNGVLEDNSGLTVGLYNRAAAKDGTYRPQVWFGFGKTTCAIVGKFQKMAPGVRHEMTVDYDGIDTVTIIVDGKTNATGKVTPGGPIAPPCFSPVVGDRGVGNFLSFNGTIHSLKIATKEVQELLLQTDGRRAFRRDESQAAVTVTIKALADMGDVAVLSPVRQTIGGMKQGECRSVAVPVSNKLMPGEYPAAVKVSGVPAGKAPKTFFLEFTYRVAPIAEENPYRILMWGYEDDFRILQKTGFNFGLQALISPFYFKQKQIDGIVKNTYRIMDDMLCSRFYWWDYACTGHWGMGAKQFPALTREGKPYVNRRGNNMIDPTNPGARKFLLDHGRLVMETYKGHPVIAMVDLQSEIHDKAVPLFGQLQKDAFRKFSGGLEFPMTFGEKTCAADDIPGFPPLKIIPDTYAPLIYFQWFWKEGDGWKAMNEEIARLYHSTSRNAGFKSYFAPSARTAPIWGGNHGDIKGQWTYSNPDPIRMAAAADELSAITADVPGQPIILGIQIICYRNQLAPAERYKGTPPEWVKKHPSAAYITLPPDMMNESIWCCLSRKVDGLLFHGDGSLYAPPIKGAKVYTCTNTETEPVLSRLLHQVAIPLGQTLRAVPERQRDIAILNSFPSAIFAGRGSYGWGGWTMDIHQAFQYAGYDPRMILDEEILRDDLKGVKVLVLAHCDVMTEGVVAKINAFQRRGGIVIADGTEVPAILPDFRVTPTARCWRGDIDKSNIQAISSRLKETLQGRYESYSTTSNLDLIAHVRSWKTADYLFVINDRRTFGDYVGQWERVMEKGLPNQGVVTVNRGDVGAVYDLVTHQPVPFTARDGRCEISVNFTTTDGRCFLLLPSPVKELSAKITGAPVPGKELAIEAVIRDAAGKAVAAMLPVKVELSYANGVLCDASGYVNAVDGRYANTIRIPENAPTGPMTLKITELASGKSVMVQSDRP